MNPTKTVPLFLIFVQITVLIFLWPQLKKSLRIQLCTKKKDSLHRQVPLICLSAHMRLQIQKKKRIKIRNLIAYRMLKNKYKKRSKKIAKILLTYL